MALAYGAGLATGLAHFPAPLVATLILLPLAVRPRTLGPAACLAILLAGHVAGRLARAGEASSCAALLGTGPVELALRVEEPVDSGGARTSATLPGSPCGGAVSVRWPVAVSAPAGAEFEVAGRWRPREGRFGRPGGILVVSRAERRPSVPGLQDRLRSLIHQSAQRLYGRRAPLVDALVLGRRADLDRQLLEEFAAAGLMHLLAISGFHLGLLAGWVFVLSRALRLSRERSSMIAAGFAVGYTVFLGWPAPAARAAVLAVVLAIERQRQRMPQGSAVLGTTALLILLVDPWAALDLGGWLSLSALWGGATFAAWWRRRVSAGPIGVTFATSLGATLATAPVTAAALGTVALGGILLNLVAIPLAALAMPAVVASLAVGALLPAAAAPFASGAGIGLGLLQEVARWGARLPAGHFTMAEGLGSAVPWVVLLAAVLWTIRRTTGREAIRRGAWIGVAGIWASLAVFVAPELFRRPDEGPDLALHFLDVGQGDAAAIRTPGGHWILVDGGPAGPGGDAGRAVVAPFLRRHGARRLDAVVLSHAHADHLGGIPSILDRIPSGEVLDPGMPSAESLYGGFLAQLEELDTPWIPARRGDEFVLDSVRFRVLHPDSGWPGWGMDLNENSLVLSVEYRQFRAIFAGDAGLAAEASLAGRVGSADLLKVGHHGSRGSSGAPWLGELRPIAAVISVGEGNRYGHPAREALDRLAEAGTAVYRTDQAGTIEVRTDGATMTIHSRLGVATHTVSEP